MLMMCLVSIVIVTILWFIIVYSLAFAPDTGSGLIGGLDFFCLSGVGRESYAPYSEDIPHLLFMTFQLMFAILTVAIVASPFAERVNFGAFCLFISIWLIIVYAPIAHWVWGDGGILKVMDALDFAGGTVVHINVGFAALAVALVIGPREGYKKEPMEPSNIPYVLLGIALLWFGYFGFNGGSALAANDIAVLALFNTHLAACAGAFVWTVIEYFKTDKKYSPVGFASGALAGLVGVTPAAGFVEPWAALILGVISSVVCFFVLSLRAKSRIDESLDAISIHGTGGIIGAILVGVFATVGARGAILGNINQVWIQIIGVFLVVVYSFVVTFILAWIINKTIGFRVSPEDESTGLDIVMHGIKP
jgi:Amt family ammonium transporter